MLATAASVAVAAIALVLLGLGIASGEVVMQGNVLMTQGQTAIKGEKLVINLKSGTGRMEGGVTTTFTPGGN